MEAYLRQSERGLGNGNADISRRHQPNATAKCGACGHSLSQTRGAPKERNNHTLDQGNSRHREFAELGQHVPQLHLEHTAHTINPPSTSPPRSARDRLAHTYRVRKVLVTSILGGPLHPREVSPSAEHLACGLDKNAAHTCENCCVSTWKQKCTAHAHAATCPVVQPDRPRSP